MNCSFKIELIKEGRCASIYSIKFEGEIESEFIKFLNEFKDLEIKDINNITTLIDDMADRYGTQENLFKPESKRTDNVYALPNKKSNLRLYCLRYSNVSVILGNGGIKLEKERTYQQNPRLNSIVKQLVEISNLIDQRIKDKEIIVEDNKLTGNLEFNFND